MKSLAIKNYAKINLSLDVIGKREDGYHDVKMVMHAIDLFDEMRVRLMSADEDKITLKTDKYYIPVDERNTAYKAAKLMCDKYMYGKGKQEIRIDIKKNIPVAAGLAGGSANAAGVIIALNSLWELRESVQELCKTGEKIGADVPFCIMTMYGREQQKTESLQEIGRAHV